MKVNPPRLVTLPELNVRPVIVDVPKNAVPVGTVAGVQLAAVLKSELTGAIDQVASRACAGIAASKAAAVVSKCARIAPPPSQGRNKQSDQRHASDVDSGTSNGHREPTARPPPRERDRGE